MTSRASDIARQISAALGRSFVIERERSVGGGCINQAVVLESGSDRFFVKLNRANRIDMFAAEAEGLEELAAADAVRVPRPLCFGTAADTAFLAMEYIDFGAARSQSAELLGRQLAALHRHTAERFGWQRDNTIGATPQINTRCDDWVVFWRDHRLAFQLELAASNGYRGRLQADGDRLLARLGALFASYSPAASLLHGDLWGGNYAADGDGNPVIFDPAVYYGDRETDIAMTELFGGFSQPFYAGYAAAWPLDQGYAVRKHLYNLYHVLNHLNLFGGGYRLQAEGLIERVLAHC